MPSSLSMAHFRSWVATGTQPPPKKEVNNDCASLPPQLSRSPRNAAMWSSAIAKPLRQRSTTHGNNKRSETQRDIEIVEGQ